MERLITVQAMAERYGCSLPTARKYIRECVPHLEKPLVTFPWALREWEESRAVIPAERSIKKTGRIIVPRRRG